MTSRIGPSTGEDLCDADLLLWRPGVWVLPQQDGAGRVVLLSPGTGHYHAVPGDSFRLLAELGAHPLGMSIASARRQFPAADIGGLARIQVLDRVPAQGARPRKRFIFELWLRNLWWRSRSSSKCWRALTARLSADFDARRVPPRPLVLLQLQASARVALALPFTSAKCTHVALTLCDAMRSRDLASVITLTSMPDTREFHAQARVGAHIVDPADAIFDGYQFESLDPMS